ncbi:MAG: hypothetical protein HUJ93_00475 [Bacteroidales bacterium]|nr:hypothetical protein [Bacteroidales bacterium]
MKKFAQSALLVSILMMCAFNFNAMGQARRGASNESGNSASQVQNRASSSSVNNELKAAPTNQSQARRSSSSSAAASNASAGNKGQVQDYRGVQRSSNATTSTSAAINNAKKNNSSAVRSQGSSAGSAAAKKEASKVESNNQKASGQVSSQKANNQKAGEQKAGSQMANKGNGNNINANAGKGKGNEKNPIYNKPQASQYNKQMPESHKNWERPYLEIKHKPVAAYQVGEHNFGYRTDRLPFGAKDVVYNNKHYYYHNGVFYKKYWLGGYVVCRPPKGINFASASFNIALQVAILNNVIDAARQAKYAAKLSKAYYDINDRYGIRSLKDYEAVIHDNNATYYYQDGVFYTLIKGKYYVVEAPIGALVTELPYDYEEVYIEGETFYLVENTLYKVTVLDGALYFEVVCNL